MIRSEGRLAALTFLLASALLVPDRPTYAQAWLDSLRTINTDRYELYAPTEEDLKQARRELDYAARQFEHYFGAKPPKIAVVLRDANPPGGYNDAIAKFRQRGLPLLGWITDRGWEAQHSGPEWNASGRRPHSESHILPHEACHKFLNAYVENGRAGHPVAEAPAPRTRTPHYGHPAIADWFDEAVAATCEHPDERAARQARLKTNLDKRIPLAELFAMPHPFSGPIQVRSVPTPSDAPPPAPGTSVGAMTFNNVLSPEIAQRATIFYAQALSVGEFLSERSGSGALGRVADGLAAERTIEEVLAILGLPADVTVLEREWLAWVRQRP